MDSRDALRRFKWLCEETARRIEEEPDDKRFGDVFKLVEEIEVLSKNLGFPEPPIQIVRYKRGVTGRPCAPEAPRNWQQLEQSVRPKFLQVFGYRLNDPEGSDAPREFAITATAEGGEDGQHWHDTSKARARRGALKTLRRWGRTLEAMETGELELKTKDPLARITEAGEDLVQEFRKRRRRKKAPADAAAIQEPAPAPPAARFQSKGDFWEVAFAGQNALLRDSKGLGYVARLLAEPNPVNPVSALILSGGEGELAQVEQTSQPILDEEAKGEYRAQLKKLNDEIEEARELGNEEEQIRLESAKDALVGQLRSAAGMHGKDRELGSGSPARRATNAAQKALDRAYRRMTRDGLTQLAQHLPQAIRLEGNAFAYRPAPPAPVWEL